MCMVMHITVVVSPYINGSHFNYSWKIQLQQQFKIISLFHVWSWLIIEVSAETEHTVSDFNVRGIDTTISCSHQRLLDLHSISFLSTTHEWREPIPSFASDFLELHNCNWPSDSVNESFITAWWWIYMHEPLGAVLSELRWVNYIVYIYTCSYHGCTILTNQIAVLEVNKSHNIILLSIIILTIG